MPKVAGKKYPYTAAGKKAAAKAKKKKKQYHVRSSILWTHEIKSWNGGLVSEGTMTVTYVYRGIAYTKIVK